MGVSFKVAKMGTRYKPKVLMEDKDDHENDPVVDSLQRDQQVCSTGIGAKVADPTSVLVQGDRHSFSDDLEVSFTLKLFQNGFSVGKATDLFNDAPEHLLHPYDKASETLFSAIEFGWLPGDIFDDLPCKYVNGAILCEIQDYRSDLIQGRDTNCTKKFPIVHKVVLHMRTEDVVKDLLSISDASWTYRNLLEVESYILKALQPDLHLNPRPLEDRYSVEPLSKKVDLGITCGWKKRKLSNRSDTDLHFINSHHATALPVTAQNFSSQFGLLYSEREVTFSARKVPTSDVNLQENNVLLETSVSHPLAMQPISKVADRCNQSALTVATTSNVDSLPNQSHLVLSKGVRCETQAVQEPLLKKPKTEPVDSSYPQLTERQTENSVLPNELLHQQTEGRKVLHERFQDKVRPSLVISSGQTRSFQGITEPQAVMATSSVKLEPVDYSFPISDVRMIKDQHRVMDGTVIQSNLLQSQKRQSSTLLRDNIPADTSSKRKCLTSLQRDLTSSQPSVHQRLLKIQAVTERYGLHKRKCKLNQFVMGKPFFRLSPLIAFLIFASKDNGKWENTSTEGSMDWALGMGKARTLTFLRQSRNHQANETPTVDREAQVRLVIRKKLNEGLAEASVLYGIEEEMFYPLLPAFTSSHSENLLATQFTSLIKREGYYLCSDQVLPTPFKADDGGLSSQWHNLRTATPSARTVKPASSPLTPSLAPFRLNLISMLPSQNVLSGGLLLQTGNIPSAVQIPSNCIFKQQLNLAAQVNCMTPQFQQWQRAYLQNYVLQRQKQQIALMGGFGAKPAGSLSLFSNAMGTRPLTPSMAMGGRLPYVESPGQFNNHGSEISSFSDSKQHLILSKPRETEGQAKAILSGIPIQRNVAGHGVQMTISNIPDMACKLRNQQDLQSQLHKPEIGSPPQQPQQNIARQQQEMTSLLQRQGASIFVQHGGSPQTQSQVHFQQLVRQPQVNQQLRPESAPRQVNATAGCYGSSKMSSQTHGPMERSKT